MEINTISALKKLGIEVIVSPYEADPQLAHLCQIGFCDSVLTEDSDILVYSAICGVPFNVFYKFDKAGSVQVINLEDVQIIGPDSNSDNAVSDISSTGIIMCSSTGMDMSCGFDDDVSQVKGAKMSRQERAAKEKEEKGFLPALKSFRGPSGRRMFAQLCILAGCDYSESVFGVGLMAAQRVRMDTFKYHPCPPLAPNLTQSLSQISAFIYFRRLSNTRAVLTMKGSKKCARIFDQVERKFRKII